MKITFASLPIIILATFGFASLSVIIVAAFFLPVQRVQSNTGIPVVVAETSTASPETADVEFTLQTIAENGKLAYRGIGGDIDGIVNPDLIVHPGDVVRVILVNGDGMPHDLFLPDFTKTEYVSKIGDRTEIIFEVKDMESGDYVYYCTVPGHRQAGQEGKLVVAKP
jgi:nitrite reductase (NO-forming)